MELMHIVGLIPLAFAAYIHVSNARTKRAARLAADRRIYGKYAKK